MKTKSRSNSIYRFPRLDTVLMVEKFIKEHSAEFKVYQLWKKLPKKMMYQTYKIILAYLLEVNRIAVDNEEKIVYIWSPVLGKEYAKRKDLEWV